MYKNWIIVVSLVVLPLFVRAQQTCCNSAASSNRFAAFANDAEFLKTHASPLPYKANPKGWMANFACADGKSGTGYFVKSSDHPEDVIIMVHEWWGLNDYIKSEADRVSADLGVSVLAIDLYDNQVGTSAEEATAIMKAMKPERAVDIIKGAIAYLGNEAHISTMGWCFGGGWAFQAALLAGKQNVGCVMYYGMPEMDPAKLKDLSGPVVGIFGKKDKWLTPKVVAQFQAAMKKAGKKLTVYSYDADHAFANPSNPNHDMKATKDAWTHAHAFLKTIYHLN